MKTIKLLLAIVTATTLNLKFATLNCNAQTSVPAGSVSGTWTLAGSPYNVLGNISIPNGTTLTIQPGVTINFQGTYKFNIQGRLLAIGTATDTIIFTAANITNGWLGIRFNNTPTTNDTSKIIYCKLQYGKAFGSFPDDRGGAFYFETVSKTVISNCRISNCTAAYNGGGICCYYCSPKIVYNTISDNTASINGGGIYCNSYSPNISNNTISNNTASNGGGIYCHAGAILSNNIISNNTASNYGGGIYFSNVSPVITNNTISNNNAIYGGGIVFDIISSPTLRNCILWGNAVSTSGSQIYIADNQSDPDFYYCNIQGGLDAFELNGNSHTGIYSNNIDSDPKFVSPSAGNGNGFNGVVANWSLQSNSPSINTGDPTVTYPATDKAGNLRVTVCRIDMGAYEYQNGTPLTATISQIQQNLCYGDTTATAIITPAGGASPYVYNYLWSNGQTVATAIGLGAGTYTVTATEASYGCSITKTITIGQPTQITFTTTNVNVLCNNVNSGSITVNAIGGTGTLQYSKNNGSTYQSSNVFTGLSATGYQIVVKDANTCVTAGQGVIITEPALLSFTKTSTNVLCKNGNSGTITVTASGGTPALQYSNDGGSTYQLSNVFSGLTANTYQIVVKDANNCVTAAQSVIITEPTLLSFTKTSIDVICKNGNSGSITVSASGGTGTLQYSKDNGSTYQSANAFTGLTAGTYQIVVKDANNCVTVAQSVIISEPAFLAFTTTPVNVLCNAGNTGSITVNASGGTGTLQYSKDNGSTYQSSNIFTGLSLNTYQIVVKDANNCVTVAQSVIISEPTLLAFTTTPVNVLCNAGNTGSITVNASGGTGTLQYSKDGGSNYQSTNILTGLVASTYQIIVKDANNCVTAAQSVIITEPTLLSFTTTSSDVLCYNGNSGSITVNASGGTGTLQYSKDNGSTYQLSNAFTGLTAGTYQIVVKDANSCVTAAQSVIIAEPALLAFTTAQSDVLCRNGNSGSITVNANGGSGTLQYSKDGGSTYQLSTIFGGLTASTYQIVVEDANNCITATTNIIVSEPLASLSVILSITDPICTNNNGIAEVTSSGGTAPYTYLWSTNNNSTSDTISSLLAGTYSVTVTDTNGCNILDSVTLVTQFPLLSIVSSTINPICTNNNGSAAITANGGTAPYTYLWSTNNNNATDTISSLLAGTYSVTVTDTNGCSILDSATLVTQFPSLSLVSSFTNASCYNNDGSAGIIPNGGAEPYSYLWSNNSISQNLSGIGSGTYSVTATDTNGCVVSETLIINNSIAPISIPICMVTVDSSSTKNVIVWEKPTDAPIDSFRIYREIASVYTFVGSVPYDEVSEFTDNANGINPNTTSYKYKLSVLDTCGNESPLSTEHHTIHVQLGVAFPQGVNLSWNDYTGFTFSQYRILRDDLGNGNWQAIDSVSFGITTYTSTDVLPNAQYIVEATRPTSCVSTRQIGTTRSSSKSNTASQTTGVNELLNDLNVLISPNPSSGKFVIELSSGGILNNNKFAVKIYNVLGEQIYLSELKQLTKNEIDLSEVPKGIYFVNVYNGDKIYTRKIVKQ